MTSPQTAEKHQEAPEGAAEAPVDIPATEGRESTLKPENGQQPKEESFSREYVENLRTENKEARLKAQRADFLATEVRRYAVKEAAAAAGLVDPTALSWTDDFNDETGLPDHDKLRSAAEALATVKPWLARPRGDVGQGEHSVAPAALSLSQLLRS